VNLDKNPHRYLHIITVTFLVIKHWETRLKLGSQFYMAVQQQQALAELIISCLFSNFLRCVPKKYEKFSHRLTYVKVMSKDKVNCFLKHRICNRHFGTAISWHHSKPKMHSRWLAHLCVRLSARHQSLTYSKFCYYYEENRPVTADRWRVSVNAGVMQSSAVQLASSYYYKATSGHPTSTQYFSLLQ